MNTYNLTDIKDIRTHGRTSKQAPYSFFWSNSGIEFNIKATNAYLNIECDYTYFEPWLTIEINGALISRLRLNKGKNEICLFRGFDKNAVRKVCVLRDTQPFGGNSEQLDFLSINTDGEFLPITDNPLKIEFFGDSITSGEGTVGARCEYDFATSYISAYNSYPRMISRALSADIQVVSQCGWGVVSDWQNNPHCNIPKNYPNVCSVLEPDCKNGKFGNQPYDFDDFKADAVVVNLGTNDEYGFNSPPFTLPDGTVFKQDKDDEQSRIRFINAVKGFIENIRSTRPDALIIWAIGIMSVSTAGELVKQAVEQQMSKDDNLIFVKFEEMTDDMYGSRNHPGVEAHKRMANTLCPIIEERLNK